MKNNIYNFKFITLLLFCIIIYTNCKKKTATAPVGKSVYAVGYSYDNTSIYGFAYKDDALTILPSKGANLRSLFATSDAIHCVGTVDASNSDMDTPAYWKNNIKVAFNGSNKGGIAYKLKIVGSDVYVLGKSFVSTYKQGYWKNGNFTVIEPSVTGKSLSLNDIAISGSDVYICGYENTSSNNYQLKYWKNGVAVNITKGTTNARANAIEVVGTDVYVAGHEPNSSGLEIVKYWKNGIEIAVSDPSKYCTCHEMLVDNGDVYIVGDEWSSTNKRKALYWKNGIAIDLTNGVNEAIGACIVKDGNDIYVGGAEQNANLMPQATIWKNGVSKVMMPTNMKYGYINDIVVK